MDFGFLYDQRRRLFRIGYRPGDASLDSAYYDLLASESRLGSFVAIAKGDVALRHWQALGRPFLAVRGMPALRSWSGSMFEYLMPSLLMREPPQGLLQRATVAAVQAQQDFGARNGLPWGVSECAYYEQDASLAFQYGPFGVPELALRRTPQEDRVIAPYASTLALLVDAPAALANLRALERLGARDRHGFIEALDFSRPRLGDGAPLQRVATYMAHHQGMSLLSLCNLLCDEAPRGWFERVPRVQAFTMLLHERMPTAIVYQSRAIPRPPHKPGPSEPSAGARLWLPADAGQAPLPTLLLGNGAYSVGLRPDGGGQSAWRGQAISRARDDLLRPTPGHAYFIRGRGQTDFCSLSSAPSAHPKGQYSTSFFAERAEFELGTEAWSTQMTVWVSPDDDVELRRVSLHNLTEHAAEFELISYFEAVLAPQQADESHPVFSNLFLRAHAADPQCLLLERRPRLAGESSLWVAHFLALGHAATEPESELELLSVQLGCDRASLLPRRAEMSQLRTVKEGPPSPRSGEPDVLETRLDPIASLSVRLRMPARAKRSLTFATAAAADASTVMALVDEYRQAVHLTRSRLMAATLARIRQRELRLSATDLRNIQDMTTPMTISCPRPRAPPVERLDRRALWRFAISGDRPILLISIGASVGLRVVRTILTAHRVWESQGLSCDVVLVNQEPSSYLMPLQHQLLALRSSVGGAAQAAGSGAGGLHLLQQFELKPQELAALRAYARIELLADGRPLARLLAQALPVQTAGLIPNARLLPEQVPRPWLEASAAGRFNADGSAFEFDIKAEQLPPRPWANVLANPHFGCIITESGGGHSWAGNSRMNQLTAWSNDPLLDPAAEHFLLQDRASDDCFGLLPNRKRNGSAGYHIQHRPGSSLFTQDRPGLRVETLLMVHPQEEMKCLRVRLTCKPDGPARRLRVLGMAEWQLGAQRRERMTLQCDYAAESQAALAWQLEHSGGFGEGCAYLLLAGLQVKQWTCARAECFDGAGSVQMPQHLSGMAGFGLDPCAALLADAQLQAGQTLEFCWVMGYGADPQAARAQAQRWQAPGALAGLEQLLDAHWRPLLSTITVATPDPLFDALVNHWLLYQTLACRLWAKAGFYQAGGAFGYRDQLQDAMALAAGRPDMLRSQLLLHASRQFPEGDVQHWWHAPGGAGVRTHFSDDLLWLPYAAQHYLTLSGDTALLDQACPFLEGPAVPEGAEDIYCTPNCSTAEASFYEHCARAIDHSLRFGEHGLPLMGCGDWNDGMNRVGHQGRGESVWLGWFLSVILRDWQPLALARGDAPRAEAWAAAQSALSLALDTHAWDGAWFRRAYFDNGHTLGSLLNAECQIDLIAQAWSVFALAPGNARATQAMLSADARLVDRKAGLLRLLDPPLQGSANHAGYIQAYPPGVRENGGQYSHAGVWALMAQAQLGNAARAWEYFCMLSPAHRARSSNEQARYGIEPYVMPGDTYSAPPYTGQGGWSWYTGSAAWLYRAATESLLGLQLQAERFCLRPCLPPPWGEARLSLRLHGKQIEVLIRRGDGQEIEPMSGLAIQPGQWLHFEQLAERQQLLLQLPKQPRP
ncbi:hypothetical protein LNV07_24835 [Paucibacter oligotrophus]|uniref:Cellobiose phosphorylase n=2 Tax=Roseateles oligotrophus TaxID=1769250 RepID=A0ABT2YMN4_9BURK|nr:hypothetical protein [Roseateles oligotrophus]